MTIPRTVIPFLVAAACLCSCSDTASESCQDPGTCVESAKVAVCGEGGVGFLSVIGGGGPLYSVLQVELGHHYVVVDTSCRFAVFEMNLPSMGSAVEGQLTAEQANELNEFLALEEWDGLEPNYGPCGVPDAAGAVMRWGDRSVSLGGSSMDPCPELPADFRHDLPALPGELASRLKALGTPASGPARYVLIAGDQNREDYPDDLDYVGAPAWPLDISPEVASMTLSGEDHPLGFGDRQVLVAEGDDARALRFLRAAFLAGQFGRPYSWLLPIEEPDGSRYQLEVRDVVQFELEGQPVVPWLAKGNMRVTTIAPLSFTRVRFTLFCDADNPDAPTAEVELEVPNEDFGGDVRYWRGGIEDLPQGTCRIDHIATNALGEVSCAPFQEVDETGSITIRAGWTTSAAFSCE